MLARLNTIMIQEKPTVLFPIRGLAERTGVGQSTLRAWERRYGLLKPQRTPKGHRLYTEADADLVRRVVKLLESGNSISAVAKAVLADPEALENMSAEEQQASAPTLNNGVWKDYLQRTLTAIEAFNPAQLDNIYNEASSLYPLDLVSNELIEPVLALLGQRWRERDTGIAEEHFFSAWLRNKLGARLHHATAAASGRTLILACVPGHRHEVGILLFALAALGRGYRVVYLGADMPLEPLPSVVQRAEASGVILSGGRELDPETTIASLRAIIPALQCPLFVGGPITERYETALEQIGAISIGSRFSPALERVAATIPPHTEVAGLPGVKK